MVSEDARARRSGEVRAKELTALASLYNRAVKEGVVTVNPVHLVDAPKQVTGEAVYLEADEAARLLDAAAEFDQREHHGAHGCLHPLVGTGLYTGGRSEEVRGLMVEDVDLVNRQILIRPNELRPHLKSRHARRSVPLWPALQTILTAHIGERETGLLFPGKDGGMITDVRHGLQWALKQAEITKNVTFHTLRRTYAATRLQTLDQGQPVSPYTVSKELGHGSVTLLEQTYGHLLNVRDRMPFVVYRRTTELTLERGA